MRQHPQKGGLVLLGGTLHDEHRMADQPDKPPPCQPRCPARTATAPETKRPIAKPRLRKLACGPVAHGGQMVQPPEAMQFIHRFGGCWRRTGPCLGCSATLRPPRNCPRASVATRKHPRLRGSWLRGGLMATGARTRPSQRKKKKKKSGSCSMALMRSVLLTPACSPVPCPLSSCGRAVSRSKNPVYRPCAALSPKLAQASGHADVAISAM